MKKIILMTALVAASAVPQAALADDDCNVPMDKWQSRDAVQQMATSLGWNVKRIKIDDGCYEIKGLNEAGKSFKAKINPQNLAIMKLKVKSTDDDRDHRHNRQQRGDASRPSDGAPANKLIQNGTAPKVQVQ
ncbi:MAG: PepSY domain-containing protein [Brucella intermedia]